MRTIRVAAVTVIVLLVAAVAAVAALWVRHSAGSSPSAGANGTPPGSSTATVRSTGPGAGYCPPPEAQELATPMPSCIPFDWNDRVKENNRFREAVPITAAQRAAAAPRADALAAALARFGGRTATVTAVRQAAAKALGLDLSLIETQGDFTGPLKNVLVGGGTGQVCVNGSIGPDGKATAEPVGRTMDGTCLPGLGGH